MGNGKKRKLNEEPVFKNQPVDNSDSDDEEPRASNSASADETSEDGSSIETFSGEEEGEDRQEDGQRMTAFNMREEMQEGHFDAEGSFIWDKKGKEVRDNWIDNIGSVKVAKRRHAVEYPEEVDEGLDKKSLLNKYETILSYLKPQESVNQAIRRLAGSQSRLSTMERLKLKKAGKLVESKQDVDVLTSVANEILLRAGNTNVYEMTYYEIKDKIEAEKLPTHETVLDIKVEGSEFKAKIKKVHRESLSPIPEEALDMYSEDFEEKEKKKLEGSERKKIKLDNESFVPLKEEVPEIKENLNLPSEEVPDTKELEEKKKKLEGSAGTSGDQQETGPPGTKEEIAKEKKDDK